MKISKLLKCQTPVDEIRELNPDLVATDCETCKWQIEMSTQYSVLNPVSLLSAAL